MTFFLRAVLGAVLTFMVAANYAQDLPAHQPGPAVSGTIRIWGDEQMREVVSRWAKGFNRHHPKARIETKLLGTDMAMSGLYTGLGDIALMGREPLYSEVQAFEWIFRYKPQRFELLNGSLDAPGKSPAVVIFVHKDNPLDKLTMEQLDAIYDYEHRRGLASIHTWDQLGLAGDWVGKPIHLYGPEMNSGTGRFFATAILMGSKNINWDRMREFPETRGASGAVTDAASPMLEALSKDRFGIAIANLHFARPEVKAVSLAASPGGPFLAATTETVSTHQYILSRSLLAFINHAPGKPVDPTVKEFLRFVLSSEGQSALHPKGDFLPLPGVFARNELKELE